MNQEVLEQLLGRMASTPSDATIRHDIAHEIGRSLPDRDVGALYDVYRMFDAASRTAVSDPVAKETLDVLATVISAYNAEITADREQIDIAALAEQPTKVRLIRELAQTPQRPGQLAERLGKDPAQITRTLRALAQDGICEVIPSVPGADNRIRTYRLTALGTDVAVALVTQVRARAERKVAQAVNDIQRHHPHGIRTHRTGSAQRFVFRNLSLVGAGSSGSSNGELLREAANW